MAKDKSKKSNKSNDAFGKPSEAKGGSESWKLEAEENIGKLFLISPLREDDFVSEEWGASKIIVADVVEINEKSPDKSVEHADCYVFGGWVKGALRGYIGQQMVLARLEQDQSKSRSKKGNPAWVLVDPSEKDTDRAKAYLESVDPFKQKGAKSDEKTEKGKKSKSDEKPEKGKKKKK